MSEFINNINTNHKLMINGATSQYDRWLNALDPGYAKVDGHSFSEMMQFAVDFGGLINFFNLSDEVDGNWVDFFLCDPNVVLASIDAVDMIEVENNFYKLINKTIDNTNSKSKFSLLSECFEYICKLVQQVNDWLYALEMTEADKSIELFKSNLGVLVKTRLIAQFDKLKVYAKGASLPSSLRKEIILDTDNLMPAWDLGAIRADDSIYSGNCFDHKINSACEFLKPIFNEFYSVIYDLKEDVSSLHKLSDTSSRHRPQVSLLMAFIRLYQYAQYTINNISDRYIRFYYDQVLREKQNTAIPDTLYLNFTLEDDESISDALVAKETLFYAGQEDDGEDIIYAADNSLCVSSAKIEKIQTLYLEKGSLIFEENNINEVIDNPVLKKIIVNDIDIAKESNSPGFQWPVFGEVSKSSSENKDGTSSEMVQSLAKMGFAIATPYLWLSGGERYVSLDIQYTEAYYENILKPLLQQIQLFTGESIESIFNQVLTDAFTLYGSSTEKWFEIESYSICTSNEISDDPCCLLTCLDESIEHRYIKERTFHLCFKLPDAAPPLAPFLSGDTIEEGDKEVIDENFTGNISGIDLTVPTLLIYLRQQPVEFLTKDNSSVYVYPLSLLDKMVVESFKVSTKVSGLSNLELKNTDGEIDSSQPFSVFGGFPVVGSYLQIYNKELFVKVPNKLKLTIDWFNLPQNDNGFKGYYQYYDIDIDGKINSDLFNNQTFKGKFSLVNQGIWSLETTAYSDVSLKLNSQEVYLFSSKIDNCICSIPPQPDTTLCNYSLFDNFKIDSSKQDIHGYYNPDESAIQLELNGPDYSFGNDLYAKNVLNAVIDDLPDTNSCRENCLCEYSPISNTIDCLSTCIEICLDDMSNTNYLSCIEKRIFLGEAALYSAIIQCLSECLLNCSDFIEDDIYKSIENKINSCMGLIGNERLKSIEKCFEVIHKFSTEFISTNTKPCLDKCKNFIDALKILQKAVMCVRTCELADIDNKECIRNCLLTGVSEAKMLYESSLTVCMEKCMQIKQELKYPNEPYLPQASKVKIDYEATCELVNTNYDALSEENSYFHILPLNGYRKVNLNNSNTIQLLPGYRQEGNLYIGFSNITQSQKLNMLFLLIEKNGVELPSIQWDFLFNNTWHNLSLNNIDSDTTHGLQNTGIVNINLPMINNVSNTILSPQYTWLRVSTNSFANLFPDVNSILPNALPASLRVYDLEESSEDTDEAEKEPDLIQNNLFDIENTDYIQNRIVKNPLFKPLPAHSINSSVEVLPGIGEIDQPIASFGGRPAEIYRMFEIRQGERLRHKQRAIQVWDYERLVLQQFPMIWKVKALSAHNTLTGNKPGEVLLVVVIGEDGANGQDVTTPMASNELIRNIQSYISKHSSTFLKLHVTNPVYVRIEVIADVVFKQENDSAENIKRLNNEIIEYLSPWYFDEAREATQGNYASIDDISLFIQTRTYVNRLDSIELNYFPKINELETDWYYLTSANQHSITTAIDESREEVEFSY